MYMPTGNFSHVIRHHGYKQNTSTIKFLVVYHRDIHERYMGNEVLLIPAMLSYEYVKILSVCVSINTKK